MFTLSMISGVIAYIGAGLMGATTPEQFIAMLLGCVLTYSWDISDELRRIRSEREGV